MGLISSTKFTTEVISVTVVGGTNVPDTATEVVLYLRPTEGNKLDATSLVYKGTDGQDDKVSSASFAQNGDNVELTIVFNSFVMPAGDVDIPVCINIVSGEQTFEIKGSFTSYINNATITTPVGQYTKSGKAGNSAEVMRKTFLADAGYYFEVEPSVLPTVNNITDYEINISKVITDGKLLSKTFVIDYTFPSSDVAGDLFTFNAEAVVIPVIVDEAEADPKIRGYSIDDSLILPKGSFRNLSIFGEAGSTYTLQVLNANTDVILDISTPVVIDSSGISIVNIGFPSVIADDVYTITIAGDLDGTFDTNGQDSSFTIAQSAQIELLWVLYNVDPNITITETPAAKILSPLISYDRTTTYSATFEFTSLTAMTESLPLSGGLFSNLDPLTNGGMEIYVEDIEPLFNPGFTSCTVILSYTLGSGGTTSVTPTLSLGTYITT